MKPMQMPNNKPIDFLTYIVIGLLVGLIISSLIQFLGD